MREHEASFLSNLQRPSSPHMSQLFRGITAPSGSLLCRGACHIVQMKSAAAVVNPCPQERCLAGAYFGWVCPNKHSETLQPQLQASPWLTSHPVTPPLTEREKTSEGKETTRPNQSLQRLEGPNAAYYQGRVFPTPAGLVCAATGMPVARECLANSSTIIVPCTGGARFSFERKVYSTSFHAKM